MKFKSSFIAPLYGAMALLAITGCSDDDVVQKQNNNVPQGNGIVFDASANYISDAKSRTQYGDYEYGDDGKKISQVIEWLDSDHVDIYSPQSPKQQVEYGIQTVHSGQSSDNRNHAWLLALGDGLQWNRSNDTQDFYAVYPSKNSMSNTAVQNRVSFEDGVLKGYVPINQQHTIKRGGETGWTAEPNMDYLYMAAINKDFTIPADGAEQDGVNLDFVPLTTTLEITIKGPTITPLASLNVQANGVPVVGNFTCDLVNGSRDSDGVPVCVSTQQGTTNDYATVSLYVDDNGTQKPLSLTAEESVTLNVFLLPTADLSNVTIRIAGFNTSSRTMVLQQGGTNITLHPHKKTCVTIPAPEINAGGTNEWITGLEGDVLVSQLSIPGTANSFSYVYDGNNRATYSAQTANFETQWNAGIRCFELTGAEYSITTNEKPWWEGGGEEIVQATVDNLDGAALLCNREPIGMTFGEAVDMIWNKVKGTDEFAMIIPSYDSNTGHPSDHNGVENYANALNAFFESHTSYEYVTYNRDLTVGEARGKLIFIARITSEEDGDEYTLPAPHQGVFVDQWGSLKDNWARRGYTLSNGTVVNNWSTGTGDTNSMEYYMNTQSSNRPNYLPSRQESNVNFVHTTTRKGGSTGVAYIQDWQRVVPRDGAVTGLRSGSFMLQNGWNSDYYTYWEESLTEKERDIWNTFENAIEANSGQQADEFYINSLDGYFVDPDIEKSYRPYVSGGTWGVGLSDGGTEGNIDAYATYINNWFYNQILGYGEDNIYGPMNIVLMDRVYEEGGGSYLPSVIINNNYRFPLVTKGGGTTEDPSTQNRADGSYASGGSVWH